MQSRLIYFVWLMMFASWLVGCSNSDRAANEKQQKELASAKGDVTRSKNGIGRSRKEASKSEITELKKKIGQPNKIMMNPQRKKALQFLANLTELGRLGRDPTRQCSYGVMGKENGITLFQSGVTDADMKHFALLPDWHLITLRENDISDAGFKHLSNQQQLRFLDIGETKITSLNPVKDAIHLQQLWCDQLEGLTDRKAIALKNFRKLKFLDLCYADIGDVTMKRLEGMKELQKLNLIATKITDDGMRSIATLPKLDTLGLYRTAISDDGLHHLYSMKQLRLLVIGGTKVTPKGKLAIKSAIPNLKVVRYESIY